MVVKSFKLFFGMFLIVGVLMSLGVVLADSFNDCWQYTGTDNATCVGVVVVSGKLLMMILGVMIW